MRNGRLADYPAAVRAVAAAAAVALFLAGCAAAGVTSRLRYTAHVPAHAGQHAGRPGEPPAGSRARSLALARWLLGRLIAPPGGRTIRRVPAQLRQPDILGGFATSVDLHRVVSLPLPLWAAVSFLTTHVPAGTHLTATGQGADGGITTSESVSYSLRSVPPGVQTMQLTATVVPGPRGGSLLRADSQVFWYPPRSAAEHIYPARYHAVILSGSLMNPKPRTVTRAITARAVIARLARLLNGMHAIRLGPIPINCPMIDVAYRLRFASAGKPRPDVAVRTDACGFVQVTVGGRPQPPLWGQAGLLITIVRGLLGLPPAPGERRTSSRPDPVALSSGGGSG
ncbi:MAG TPA: hypothetical protein VN840_05420 [Streptosporangiaceae bacterium]|nr:hypothetical protein [Streptosporangiaceae bacterium]